MTNEQIRAACEAILFASGEPLECARIAEALELDMDQTQDLLASAGLTLSRSFTFDKIIRYLNIKATIKILGNIFLICIF